MFDRRLALCVAALVALSACHRSIAPPGRLPTVAQLAADTYGGWINVSYQLRDSARVAAGELIAAHRDSLHVMDDSSKLVSIPLESITRLTLEGFSVSKSNIAIGTMLGGLSTVGNGFFLIFTLPLWIITGTAGAADYSREPVIRSRVPDELRIYARFPQGIPVGLDRSTLRAQPE